MSVLVKGMAIPTRCFTCPMSYIVLSDNWRDCREILFCNVTRKDVSEQEMYSKRPGWCPLEEVDE